MPLDPQLLWIFVLASLVLIATPGPDILFLTATGIARGPRAGALAAMGVTVGWLIHTGLATVGLAAVMAALPWAYDAIRFAGAAYLAWLGVQAILRPGLLDQRVEAARGRGTWTTFRSGVLCNVLNPKVAVFFIAFLPQFVVPGRAPIWLQLLLLGVLLTLLSLPASLAVGCAAGRVGRWLARHPRAVVWQGRVAGVVFLALAANLVLEGRRSA